MARLIYAPSALANLERAFAFLEPVSADVALAAAEAITTAIEMLEHHPMIGRIVAGGMCELVISYGRTGYLALYRFTPERDEVRILAIRHQRELDYP